MLDPENRKYIAGVHLDGAHIGKTDLFGPGVNIRPAAPGETVVLFGSGFGPTQPPVAAGQVFVGAAALTDSFEVRIGNMPASASFGGLSGAGLYQFNVVVPDLPNGDHEAVVRIGGVRTQENTFITIQR
jgi:uncharacterized protein (TIGR03437 family)